MNPIKWFFMSKYKKLLYQIEASRNNEQKLHLPNGIVLDFSPGHEYDNCQMFVLPHYSDGEDFIKKYTNDIGKIIHMNVYDCFGGDVKILAVGADRVFVEIVDVLACYSCQTAPSPGSKYWVGEWEIEPQIEAENSTPVFENESFDVSHVKAKRTNCSIDEQIRNAEAHATESANLDNVEKGRDF